MTFATQGGLCFRNAKSNEAVVEGGEGRVDQYHCAAVIARIEHGIENKMTAGGKIVEMASVSGVRFLNKQTTFP